MITIIFYLRFAMRIIHYTHINMDIQYDYHNLPPTPCDEGNYTHIYMYMDRHTIYYNTFPLILHSKDNYTLYTHIYVHMDKHTIYYNTFPLILHSKDTLYTHIYVHMDKHINLQTCNCIIDLSTVRDLFR